MKKLHDFLKNLNDPRKAAILDFHEEFREALYTQPGSKSKHQVWPGGLADHLAETMNIATILYDSLSSLRLLPFSLDSVYIVLYFHDLEKLWNDRTEIDKKKWYHEILPARGILFTPEELNALKYIHGETKDYDPDVRRMGRLAAFCHSCDCLSARLWFDEGRGKG